MRPTPSILLIKLRHHGDVLLATPVARALKAHYPKCHIDFLVYEGTEPLLKNNPDVERVWQWQRAGRGWEKLRSVLQLFLQLRRQHYDLVIHLSDQMQGALLAKFLSPQQAIGIDYPKRRHFFWRSCFSQLVPLFPSNTRHTVEQNLATLVPLGIHAIGDEAQCRLAISEEDRAAVQKKLQEKNIAAPYLVVHPTARWFFKCWEEDRFAEVIQHFAKEGWSVVLTSGPEATEQAMVATLLKRLSSPHIHSLAGALTLGELAALIEGTTLFVGVDSVPMHMAAALQKKVVALFGPSKIQEWHPWQTDYHLIKASDYGPLLDPDAVKTETQERYLSHIPVAPVIAAIEEMLVSSKK